ncbi:MAG: serine/threonine-protein kinase, partial [Gemmatimonadaceae bacterium]
MTPGATGLEGRIIADRYRVLRQIGEGGMGRVYLAEHIKMGRRCAFKVLAHGLVSDAEAIGRFNREAMNASRILHPNVAAVYDFGEASDGLVYLAMELVEGEPLSAVCARATVLPAERAVDIASQVAEGLIPAHELGIVHRDLKPDNIVVGTAKDGRDVVKIIDFGIAKGMAGDTQRVTRTGFIVGTPEYMSPEQLAGDTLDGRSDLFALGCVMYRMLTGESTFTGPSMESQIQRRLTRPPPRARAANPAVPEWLDAVVAKAMERDPGDRYQTAAELRDALRGGAPLSTARRKAIVMPAVSRRFWFGAGAVAGVTLLVSLGMHGEHAAASGHT